MKRGQREIRMIHSFDYSKCSLLDAANTLSHRRNLIGLFKDVLFRNNPKHVCSVSFFI